MYQKLHRRLTLLFTGAAGAILIIMSISYLYMSERRLTQNNFLTFSSKVDSLITSLEQQSRLSWEWILKTSVSQNFILAFFDNNVPIAYNRVVLSDEELSLSTEARQYAKKAYPQLENGSSYTARHQEFTFTSSKNETYHASILNTQKGHGVITGIILSPTRPFEMQLKGQRLRFVALNAAGVLLLLLFSHYFTGKLLAPIIESRKKQMAFIAAASHELRTPIAVINSALSAAKAAEGMKKDHFYQIAKGESLRLSTLTDDLLLLNRSDAGRLDLKKQPTELDTLLLNACESFEPLAKEHKMTITASLPEEALPLCACDRERLHQALGILISNALHYGTEGGYVKLSLSHNKSMFWIMAEDNGIGIQEEDKPYIFDRFYRGDKSRSSKSHFGLGLSIDKEIIDAHGGKIMVTDTPGGGTRFFILLP